jgi:hypothetical protein
MDPLSITAAAVSLTGAVVKTTAIISDFVRTVRSARQDMISTSRHLGELSSTLDLLRDNTDRLPEGIRLQIRSILIGCESTLGDIDTALDKHKNGTSPGRWALSGKKEVETLNRHLETYLRNLGIAVEATTLCVLWRL